MQLGHSGITTDVYFATFAPSGVNGGILSRKAPIVRMAGYQISVCVDLRKVPRGACGFNIRNSNRVIEDEGMYSSYLDRLLERQRADVQTGGVGQRPPSPGYEWE